MHGDTGTIVYNRSMTALVVAMTIEEKESLPLYVLYDLCSAELSMISHISMLIVWRSHEKSFTVIHPDDKNNE